jgi:uncharacterized protein (TIGR00661 family)
MKILYGVVGEGMGHATRSAVILEHLVARGHEVKIVVSGRAAKFLGERYPGQVVEITGLTMTYEDNVVRKLKTAIGNLKGMSGVPENLRQYVKMAEELSPDVVISDFESWSYTFARGQKIPVVSVDNMQVIARCKHAADVKGELTDYLLAKGIVKAKLPRANAYLITTFFFPPVKKDRTTLHPPILRPVVLEARQKVRTGEHVLVYQSGTSHGGLVDVLRQVDAPFRVYGLRRELEAPVTEGNVTFCPFSETGFIEDLATARAVVAGGGFSLMGEAVVLGKPMLSVPLVGQFEQYLNAAYLEKLGYGERAEEVEVEGLRGFLERAPRYAAQLAGFPPHDGNEGLLSELEHQLALAVDEGPRP